MPQENTIREFKNPAKDLDATAREILPNAGRSVAKFGGSVLTQRPGVLKAGKRKMPVLAEGRPAGAPRLAGQSKRPPRRKNAHFCFGGVEGLPPSVLLASSCSSKLTPVPDQSRRPAGASPRAL